MRSHTPAFSGWEAWLNYHLKRHLPTDPAIRHELKVRIFRVIATLNILLGLYYFIFRYTESVNMAALWFAIPLLLAETYSFIDTLLFIFMMWRPRYRTPVPAQPGAKVDVFIATYSEPIDIVRETAEAALKIHYPHQTYVLDDGNRPEMRAVCEEIGCGYITRGPEWENRPRHAKAGNVNNALMLTDGEFILILDADQIPAPQILDETLGYLQEDPKVAFVQTPQYFYNVPEGDPFGSQAPLFYGPIQQGKDGWNAAFFCGSNAILRREALFHLGLVTYVTQTQKRVSTVLNQFPIDVHGTTLHRTHQAAASRIAVAAEKAVDAIREGAAVVAVLDEFNRVVRQSQRDIVTDDLKDIAELLAEIEALEPASIGEARKDETSHAITLVRAAMQENLANIADTLTDVIAPSPDSLGLSPELMQILSLETEEALDVNPLVTFSITEDMATAMQFHALGWRSVYHNRILAEGLAPDDLGSVLGQRLRWGAGTIQVMLRDNPLTKTGLSWPQRLQYFTTMFSYFSGFASLIYLVAPIIYLLTGIAPVTSYAGEFLIRIVPLLLVNKLLFAYVSWGIDTKRGEQYSLALFPLWIQAVLTVFSGRPLNFKVTPKTRQSGIFLNLVLPQLFIAVLLLISMIYASFALLLGWRSDTIGVLVNIFWGMYDLMLLSVIIRAAVYNPKDA